MVPPSPLILTSMEDKRCGCGCGSFLQKDRRGRIRTFIKGHNSRLDKHSMIHTQPTEKICTGCQVIHSISAYYLKTYTSKTGEKYQKPDPKCKECVKEKVRNDPSGAERSRRRRHELKTSNPIEYWSKIRIRSFRQKTPKCDLTAEFLIELYRKQDGRCFYTGATMTFPGRIIETKDHGQSWRYPERLAGISLDRLDPQKGYMKGNVVFCSYRINTMKGSYTETEFYQTICSILECRRINAKATS